VKPQTTQGFLEQKLRNFRAFIEPHCATEQQKAKLKQYDSLDAVMPFLLQAVAAEKLGQTDALVAKFCDGFQVDAETLPPFRAKVRRYLDMFREVLTT
jgi:cytochrome P450